MEWKKKCLRLKTIPLVATYIGFALYIVCFATPAWIGYSDDVLKVTLGLFIECKEGSTCGMIKEKDNMFRGAQAVGCLGFMSYLAFVLSSSLTYFNEDSWKRMRTMKNVNFIVALFAGTFVSVAHLILLQSKAANNASLGYSGIIGVIAAFTALVLCPIYIMDSRHTKPRKIESNPEFPKNIPPTAHPMKDTDRGNNCQESEGSQSPIVCTDKRDIDTNDQSFDGENNENPFGRQGTLIDLDFELDNPVDDDVDRKNPQKPGKLLPLKTSQPTLYINSGFNPEEDDDILLVPDRYNQPMTPFPERLEFVISPVEAFANKKSDEFSEPIGRDVCLTPVSSFPDEKEDEFNEDSFTNEDVDVSHADRDTPSKNDNDNKDQTKYNMLTDEDDEINDENVNNLFSIDDFTDQITEDDFEEVVPSALPLVKTKQLYARSFDDADDLFA